MGQYTVPKRVVKAAVRGRSKTLRRQLFPFRCDLSGVSRYVSGCGGVSSVGRGIVIVRDVLFSFDVNVYRSALGLQCSNDFRIGFKSSCWMALRWGGGLPRLFRGQLFAS